MKKINEEKIVKEIIKLQKEVEKDNLFLTVKGIVSMTVNLMLEQLKNDK